MRQEDFDFLQELVDNFNKDVPQKYAAGKAEHGGNLWEMDPRQMAKELRNEVYDASVYTHGLIKWIDKLVRRICILEQQLKDKE